jgi:hypothetical protein
MAQTVKRKRRRIPPEALSVSYRLLTGLFGDGRGQPRRMRNATKRTLAIEALLLKREGRPWWWIGAFIRGSLNADAAARAAHGRGDYAQAKALYCSAFDAARTEIDPSTLRRLAHRYVRDAEQLLGKD